MTPDYTPVYAAADGKVSSVSATNMGMKIIIYHCIGGTWSGLSCSGGTRWYTTYLHVTDISSSIFSGALVRSGDLIAKVHPVWDHLHFELGLNSRAYANFVNPWGRDNSPWDGCMWNDQSICANVGSGTSIAPPRGNSCVKPLIKYYNPSISDHFYTISWDELGAGRDGWQYEGVIGYLAVEPSCYAPGAQPLYRYSQPHNGDHFYTPNWSELGSGNDAWNYDGVAGYVLTSPDSQYNTQPLYNYYNSALESHYFTPNWNEFGNGSGGWVYEGIKAYIFTEDALAPQSTTCLKPFMRYYNSGTDDHYYTPNWNEMKFGANGWTYEGVEGYLATSASCYAPNAKPVYKYYTPGQMTIITR